MIPKSLEDVREEDLQSLVDNSVLELWTMEYKGSLPGNQPKERKEFLADVSSFANARGGDLIFGIREEPRTGRPKELTGLDVNSVDQVVQRLDSLMRHGIEPRPPSATVQPVSLSNGKTALVIRIGRSWLAPHRVSLEGHNKFYTRSSNGKYEMDVSELRTAFAMSAGITERIRKFREERLSTISADEGPMRLGEGGKIVLHLIPIDSFDRLASYDVGSVASSGALLGKMLPIGGAGAGTRYTLEGFLMYDKDDEGRARSYVQLFRTGVVEAVDSSLLRPRGAPPTIPSVAYELALIKGLPRYLSLIKAIGAPPPIFLFPALLGVRGYCMGVAPGLSMTDLGGRSWPLDRDILLLPEVVTESFQVDAACVLRPCFDAVWNACGFPGSRNYNQDGRWERSD